MNARTFDKQATAGVTGYLTRHSIEATDLRIKSLRFGRVEHFRFFHRGKLVADVAGRSEALRWLRDSNVHDCLGNEPEREAAK